MSKNRIKRSLINRMCTVYSALSLSSNLVVKEINEPDSTILFLSDNYNRKGISAHGKEVPVVLLNNGFCFYGSISYKHQPKKDDLLEGISLQFFFEEKLLFRAELNRKKENTFNDDIEHPQPHWHFHILLERPYQKGNLKSDFNFFVQKETQFEQSIKKEVALSEMHFPMDFNNAYLGSMDFDQKWNEDKIKDWINMTTQSIMNELDFIKVKLHL